MGKVALRGLLARKTRVALTALAVALGVTLIAGTYVFTDTINRSFDRIFSSIYAQIDVVVTPDDNVETSDGISPPLSAAVLDRVKTLPGVDAAEGSVADQTGVVLGKDGKPIKTGGAPTFINSLSQDKRFSALEYPEGTAPAGPGELALDTGTAERKHLKVGDTIGIQADAPRASFRITGLFRIAGADSLGGSTQVVLTLPEAQRITGKVGQFDEIDVAGRPGTDKQRLAAEVRSVAGNRATVRTGEQEAASQTTDIGKGLSVLTTALLAFGGIALFVGAFLIFNTFSITVAQRAREFALLRTLGASRRQVLRSVLVEGLVLGAIGSLAGLALGILVAKGLRTLFKAVGVDLPSSGTVVETRTIVVSLLVGLIVTMLSSLAPALRATRVPPVAALREGVALPETRSSRLALPLALALTTLGVALMAVGLFAGLDSGPALSFLGGGAAATFLGVALLSPRLVGPIASVVGRPIEAAFGTTGRLARENTVRQPGRTAVTAAALMIGVALVTFAAIFAAGAKATISDAIDTGLNGQAVLQNVSGFGPFSAGAAKAVGEVPGVAGTSSVRFVGGKIPGGDDIQVSGIDPRSFGALYNVTKGGEGIGKLAGDTALVAKKFAKQQKLAVGDTVRVLTPTRKTVALRVGGIVDDRAGLLGKVVVDNAVVARDFGSTKDDFVLVSFAPGGDDKAVKHAIDQRLAREFPQVEALTASQFKNNQADQVGQLLNLIYALLALAIIVSLFGIVNTLVLSITERTRELGMLRAIGTSRRQVRRMIRYEAVITAMIGGVLGLVLGVVLSLLVTRALDDFSLAIPVGTLILVLVLSALAGVLAAVLPARRASRLDVLDALAYE